VQQEQDVMSCEGKNFKLQEESRRHKEVAGGSERGGKSQEPHRRHHGKVEGATHCFGNYASLRMMNAIVVYS
jgi:hypothetical protein